MNDFKVIVPNLDRRLDRWYACVGALRARRIPDNRIHRFSAHDGEAYNNAAEAQEESLKSFPNSTYLSTKIEVGGIYDKHFYCWCWTWYEIMIEIANQSNDAIPVLFLVDDIMLHLDYRVICELVESVYDENTSFKILQLNTVTVSHHNLPRINQKELTLGLRGNGDQSNIYSAEGARYLLALANNHGYTSPEHVTGVAANQECQTGCYSTVRNWSNWLSSRFLNPFQDGRQGIPKRWDLE